MRQTATHAETAPPETPANLLDPTTIAQGEALGLLARQVVEGFLSGEHKSPFRGFAIEFTQHREYAPGDDLRHIDWKVLARSDRFMLKQYEQETNFVCHIVLDASASMLYGSSEAGPSKLQYARQMAACLAYLVLLQRDAVSLTVFDGARRHTIPRTSSMSSLVSMLTQLLAAHPKPAAPAAAPAPPTSPAEQAASSTAPTPSALVGSVLHELALTNPRKGIVVLISDLLDDEEAILSGIRHCRFAGHEVVVFQTLDPAERSFPFEGTIDFADLEHGGRTLTKPADIRKTYLAELNAFLDRIRRGCENNRCHYTLVDTGHPLAETLTAYLAHRQRTARH